MIRLLQDVLLSTFALTGLIGVLWLLAPTPAHAACNSSVTSLNYGTFPSPNATAVDITATVTTTCNEIIGTLKRICVFVSRQGSLS
jgi:hypothetical protein